MINVIQKIARGILMGIVIIISTGLFYCLMAYYAIKKLVINK
jgi:hypothetical protein